MENTPVVQTSSPEQTPIPPSPNKKYFKLIIAGTIILVVFISGGLFLGKAIYSPPDIVPVISTPTISQLSTTKEAVFPTIVSTSTTTNDPTKNWRTYVIKTYSFKYPSTWQSENLCSLVHRENSACFFTSDFQRVSTGVIIQEGGMEIEKTKSGMLMVIVPADYYQDYPYSIGRFCHPGGPSIITNCKENMINGELAAEREERVSPENDLKKTFVDFKEVHFPNKKYSILFYFAPDIENIAYQTLDQILSTFKFIGQNQGAQNDTSKYVCPKGEYVDCMPKSIDLNISPTPDPNQPPYPVCSKEFLDWATKNCPGFKGVTK